MVLDAQEKTKNAEENADKYRAGLRALFQRIAEARARDVVEDEARVEALKKQLDEAKQRLAAAQSDGDYLHWYCQVNGLIQDLELAKQH